MLKNNFTNLFTQWFEKPKISIFNLSKPVSTDVQIGKWYPTYWTICGFGDSEKGRSTHKMRLAPMLAPNFADLRVNEHAVVVPLRVLMRDYEAKFNYAKNRDGASLPTIEFGDLLKVYTAMGKLGISPIGSLFDFCGLPVFGDFYKQLMASIDSFKYYNTNGPVNRRYDFIPTSAVQDTAEAENMISTGWIFYRGVQKTLNALSLNGKIKMFWYWFVSTYAYDTFVNSSTSVFVNSASIINQFIRSSYSKDLDGFIRFVNDTTGSNFTVVSALDGYFSYVFTITVSVWFSGSHDSDSPILEREYTILPLMAYHRAVADWAINSNVTDPDTYLETYVYGFKTNLLDLANRVANLTDDEELTFVQLVSPKDRLWDLDYFTSQLPESAQGEDIVIPANSSVIDLAKLTSIQKLAMKLSFSSRYRDVVWNIFNIKPSDARLQQSSVIQSNQYFVQIGETIQTSETTVSSVLGSFCGRGFSAGTKKGYHIFCEEPCLVMNFFSLVAKPTYSDALHPLIHLDDIYDFPIPDMDVLGNQPQYTDLLTGNPEDTEILGYSRQYMEWLGQFGTVHNNMKTSLDYWTLSRRFDSEPALNEEFLTINPKDDYDRIFAVPDSSHAFLDIYYDVKVTRPVRRSVRILV